MSVADGAALDGPGEDDRQWWHGTRARVFISCGQRGAEERNTAAAVRDLLRDQGFTPYLAVEVHSPGSLTEGIYQRLQTADYFLFIDFRRDPAADPGKYHGSMFSNQELGIASFLGIEMVPLVQSGIPREGILAAIQGNAISFERFDEVTGLVRKAIRESAWDCASRRELIIERIAGEFDPVWLPGRDSDGPEVPINARYYHLRLLNRHWRILATNCIVHALAIRDLATGEVRRPDAVELKFKHVTAPAAAIPPRGFREFDGIIIRESPANRAWVGILNVQNLDSESALLQHLIQGPGDFEIELVAYSREFAPARAVISLHLGATLDEARVELLAIRPRPQRESGAGAAADQQPS